jgi:DUF1680 family protein
MHHHKIRPPDLLRIQISDRFWSPRLEILRNVTLPSQHQHLLDTGRIAALDPEFAKGDSAKHHKFWDSDIAKWMEAAAYSISTHPDPVLEGHLDKLISAYDKLQCDDGYLNSWFTKVYPDRRWTNLRDDHELYCAGHLLEAAIAHQAASGKTEFLDVVTRYVDYIGETFGYGEGKRRGYPGHEELELALAKLFEITRERRHLDLAMYFVDERGSLPHFFDEEAVLRGDSNGIPWGGHEYYQAHLPVRKQNIAAGHAVRAMYLYAGMTDLFSITGDKALEQAVRLLWDNVCNKQMYVTGSVGAAGHGEKFTFDYDLPEETSYCETCAAIGLVFWNYRLFRHYGEGRYVDIIERALYNGVLSGISLTGDQYFYVNPLASIGKHHRQDWFGCACCPPNIARLLASLGQYVCSEGDAAWVNLYCAGRSELAIGDSRVVLNQETEYPWDGNVRIGLDVSGSGTFGINLRLPDWCKHPSITLNGTSIDLDQVSRNGYAHIDRGWKTGDTIEIQFPMPVERVYANPRVRMAAGKVVLRRGPLIYCLEETDNDITPLSRISLPVDAEITTHHDHDLLGGVTTLSGSCLIDSSDDSVLYSGEQPKASPQTFTAIPYYAWDNREPGFMQVWLREAR